MDGLLFAYGDVIYRICVYTRVHIELINDSSDYIDTIF